MPATNKIRQETISAHEVAKICGLSPYGDAESTMDDKRNPNKEFSFTNMAKWGITLERFILEKWSKFTGHKLEMQQALILHEWQSGHIDAFQVDAKVCGQNVAYQFDKEYGIVPAQYDCQVQWYMDILRKNGTLVEYWDLAVLFDNGYMEKNPCPCEPYLNENGEFAVDIPKKQEAFLRNLVQIMNFEIFTVPFKPNFTAELVRVCWDFHKRLMRGEQAEQQEVEYPQVLGVIEPSLEIYPYLSLLKALSKAKKISEKAYEYVSAKVMEMAGEDTRKIQGDSFSVTFVKNSNSVSYKKAFEIACDTFAVPEGIKQSIIKECTTPGFGKHLLPKLDKLVMAGISDSVINYFENFEQNIGKLLPGKE